MTVQSQNKRIHTNNRIFAIIWIVLETFFCFMYGFYAHTASFSIQNSGGLLAYLSAVGIAVATIIGIGGIMSYATRLKWSGFGFALLITALCYQYYFLANAFWTKADIQNTGVSPLGVTGQPEQLYKDDFFIWASEATGYFFRTFGNTVTGAFKMALTLTIAFSAVVGRAGPLEILFFVLFGGAFYQLNRQIVSRVNHDIGGSITIFMFGGILGTVVAIMLAFTKQKQQVIEKNHYSSSKFNTTMALIGSAFFWVFYPLIFCDVPSLFSSTVRTTPFLAQNGMINAYWAISTCVVTSLALSAIIHAKITAKDLIYGTFAGASIVGTSAPHMYDTTGAIVLGMIAGLIQPFLNLAESKLVRKRICFSTCVPFVFAVQGFLGSMAAGIFRAIQNNTKLFNYTSHYPYPFTWRQAAEYYRATYISLGISIGAGVIVGILCIAVSAQQPLDYFDDVAYWIVSDDGLREQKGQILEEDDVKGAHSYI